MAERKPQCILGYGDCPPDCPNHNISSKITEKLGDDFDPFLSRLSVVFRDVNPNVNVVDVAAAMSRCVKKNKTASTD